jgi:hypothetical protein
MECEASWTPAVVQGRTALDPCSIKPSRDLPHGLALRLSLPSRRRPTAMTNTVLICILSVTAAFGAIGASVGLNALIKSNAEKARLRHAAGAAGGQIYINTDDVLHSGIVIAVACGMISTLAFTSVNMLMLKSMQALEERTRRLRALLVLGSTVWLFTAQAAFTIFVTTRHAKVTLFVGGLQLPDKVVAEKAKLLGSTSVYKDISYCACASPPRVTCPWIADPPCSAPGGDPPVVHRPLRPPVNCQPPRIRSVVVQS